MTPPPKTKKATHSSGFFRLYLSYCCAGRYTVFKSQWLPVFHFVQRRQVDQRSDHFGFEADS